ncbi:hypothetical protein SDRG_01563 [Saprolegnia diclina VS20]|uniref:CCT domain-containing protein n=1 Tax=Saprolegnia diclina (strain VS20) TaxID=1156394 RepID=T0QTV2_SAPDV|nr:hypothetical protein SDRG_01563 [Saprolegnia diclina VS20]EQC41604.1 hypothetical protein SDRG_01563 [Saprolegnia diclina VS20]|eukprot:XP_008605318.1 hypothetical protein SDRG_01563 [Saprolegnia diclina VS20]
MRSSPIACSSARCLADDLWYLDASFGLKYEAFLALSPTAPESPPATQCHPRISLTWPSRSMDPKTTRNEAAAPRRVGNYSPQTRRQRIQRFHAKRHQRQLKFAMLADDGDEHEHDAEHSCLSSPLWVPSLPDDDLEASAMIDDTFQELCLPDEVGFVTDHDNDDDEVLENVEL